MKIPIVHFSDDADGQPPNAFNCCDEGSPMNLLIMRAPQQLWAARPVSERLRVIRVFRNLLAARCNELADLRPSAPKAEVLASEIIPLADACRFLEREGGNILKARRLAGSTAPIWLRDTRTEIHREPYGIVLVVSPSNYPLFLPGVVIVQALAAGNAVLVKPAAGCAAAANALVRMLYDAGLPANLCALLPEDDSEVDSALTAGVDKVILTGSAATGRKVLRSCANALVPATMELSGCDAMFVRADADVSMAARALVFGLRWNRGATCIAPRRVFVHRSRAGEFEQGCQRAVFECGDFPVNDGRARRLAALIVECAASGAHLVTGEVDHHGRVTAPVILRVAAPSRLLVEDHFAPLAAVVSVHDDDEAIALNDTCPYALGASVFSADEDAARRLASRIDAGCVTVNDVIVPTADPRVPFGGRRNSGFGVTRGAEGLLELTRPKVVITRRGTLRPHFSAARQGDAAFFSGFLSASHSGRVRDRLAGVWRMFTARQGTSSKETSRGAATAQSNERGQ